ncbi:GerAB/ArcD/ProY family transporter [Evansella clarkii]|uniref:GerAB/ArcD/ProY family transporter n=1 Tax=Evansella clarkii TaxID=79879 RepID=UPI000B436D82|nr:GerAB/ArcD/ProY family transporter [Evansella clarkii]
MKLSTYQCVALIVMVQFGIGILSLPSLLMKEADSLGWISILIAGLFVQLLAVVYHFSLNNNIQSDFFHFLENLSGKFFSKLYTLILILYFLSSSCIIMNNYVYVLNIWAYPLTPHIVLIIIIWICMVYFASSKVHTLSRISVMFFYLMLLLLLLLLWHFQDFNLNYLKPPQNTSFVSLLYGTLETSLSLIGFELIILFSFYLKQKSSVLKVLTISNWVTTFIYVIIVLIAFALFSSEKLEHLIWPTLSAYKLIEFRFIQRLEFIIVFVWLPLIVITTGSYLWGVIKGVNYLFPNKNKAINYFIVLAVPILAWLPQNHPRAIKIADYVGYIGISLAIITPFLLLLLKRFGGSTK